MSKSPTLRFHIPNKPLGAYRGHGAHILQLRWNAYRVTPTQGGNSAADLRIELPIKNIPALIETLQQVLNDQAKEDGQ
jgi:hypothetical protein